MVGQPAEPHDGLWSARRVSIIEERAESIPAASASIAPTIQLREKNLPYRVVSKLETIRPGTAIDEPDATSVATAT